MKCSSCEFLTRVAQCESYTPSSARTESNLSSRCCAHESSDSIFSRTCRKTRSVTMSFLQMWSRTHSREVLINHWKESIVDQDSISFSIAMISRANARSSAVIMPRLERKHCWMVLAAACLRAAARTPRIAKQYQPWMQVAAARMVAWLRRWR